MSERKLNHFSNLSHLLISSTDIVVTNLLSSLFVVTLNGFSFVKELGVIGDNASLVDSTLVLNGNDLEFDGLEVVFRYDEAISNADGSEVLLEVRNQVGLSNVSTESFNSVTERQDMDLLSVLHFTCRSNLDGVTHGDSQVSSDALVGADFFVLHGFIFTSDDSTEGLLSLLTLHDDVVTLENVELVHLGLSHLNGGVIVHSDGLLA